MLRKKLNWDENEECTLNNALRESLLNRWMQDLKGMKEEFLISPLEKVSQHLRLDGIYPARVSQASDLKMTQL